ncbi:MAG: AI-2E family transporter [Muribaculaceae bacterium]|nr:AI-2E family transporter [Muribaculaceae bacterium]
MAQDTITQESPRKRYDFDRVARLVITLVTVVAIIYVLNYLSSVLLPFLIGSLLAYMINPLVELLQRALRLKSRIIPTILGMALTIGGIALVLWLVIPYLVREFTNMGQMLAKYAQSSFTSSQIPPAIHDFLRENLDFENLQTLFTREQWIDIIKSVASGTWSVVGGTWSILLSVVTLLIVLLYMFLILIDYEKITHAFKGAIPPRYRRLSFRIMRDVGTTMSRYFRGQALVSFFVGVIFAIEFSIIGLPMAIVFGMFIGLLNMVPYLQLTSIPIAAFLCLVASVATGGSFWALFGWTIGAYCLCQVIQDLVLIPLIMKQQMGLNPAIIFLALSIWGYLLGLLGLIIALPLTTLIVSYYSEFVLHTPNPLYHSRKKKKTKTEKFKEVIAREPAK